jgi:hypothetical protein
MLQLSPTLAIPPTAKSSGDLQPIVEGGRLINRCTQRKTLSPSDIIPQGISSYADPTWMEPRRILQFRYGGSSLQQGLRLDDIEADGLSLEEPNGEFAVTNPGELLVVITVR